MYLPVTMNAKNVEPSRHSIRIQLLCFDLSRCSRLAQFFICSLLVFVLFIVYGYAQESLFRLKSYPNCGWYLTLVQFCYYTLFALLEQKLRAESSGRKVSLGIYAQLALYTVGTIGLSNASLAYLNYPTNVMFKSCKLIPVLIGGILIQGKRYGLLDFLAAGCMSIGLILFTLVDVSVSPNFSARGYILICIALAADAMIGNVQEREIKKHGASNCEVLLYSYSIGLVYLFVINIFSGELFTFLFTYNEDTKNFYFYATVMSLSGFFGIDVILSLVKTFGAFVAITVTTCRKAVTIVLSFLLFAKPFSIQYVWSATIVFFGILLSTISKNPDVLYKKVRLLRLLCGFCLRKVVVNKHDQQHV